MGNPQHYPPPQARHGGRGSSAPPFSLSLSRQQNVMIIVGVEVARESVTVNGRGRPSERVVAADTRLHTGRREIWQDYSD